MIDLNFNYHFDDINSLSGLQKLDKIFMRYLESQDPFLNKQLTLYRIKNKNINEEFSGPEFSDFLLKLAPLLDDFISELFSITEENLDLKKKHKKFDIIYECKRKFVQRYAIKKYNYDDILNFDFKKISSKLKKLLGTITELSIAEFAMKWQLDSEKYHNEIETISKYCALMVHNNSELMIFDIPKKLQYLNQQKISSLRKDIILGFDYRDQQKSLDKAVSHAKYCIYCHKQEKDYCRKGIQNNDKAETNKNGCPLNQKISEMHLLKSSGFNIGALGVIMIDNPLVAATGHRICNDCMKSCIYQKQDPVNTPIVESNILEEVLSLPWGVEIYLLLSRWNPLNISNPLPKLQTNKNILIAGLGPAGFALSHYLLNEGHNVTAIDGLKIDPLQFNINKPIKYWDNIKEKLSTRKNQGFGGVVEYGITNRWDKNNLTLIRLMLERRANFNIYSGVRLGSNITTKQAFDLGFNHIALCLGAGKPSFIKDQNYFANGVKSASDFLMNLQQGTPYIKASNSNLLLRMPSVILGCGLTAIDAAVEILHYYPIQVENFYSNWQNKVHENCNLTKQEREIAEEFISHAKLFRLANSIEAKLKILQDLGGVTIAYRKTLKESPAYRLNHEEVEHAISIGVRFEELLSPKEIIQDKYGWTQSLLFSNNKKIKAKSVLIAIGTEKNQFEDIDNLENDNNDGTNDSTGNVYDEMAFDIFKSKDHKISYFGDCNQKYKGNVVKALASAKNGYKAISKEIEYADPTRIYHLDDKFKSYIHTVNILSDKIIEILIHSPLCVENFQPGQFFKLQNYSKNLENIIEPLALTGAYVDKKHNLISLIILELGRSSKLCRNFQKGDEVVLMGPIGTPTKIFQNKNVVLIGGGLGNAVLVPIAESLKNNNCHVRYFAGYRNISDRFYPQNIEKYSDQVIWSFETEIVKTHRTNDLSIKGNVIDSIFYAKKSGLLERTEKIICIGSDSMMSAVANQKNKLFGDIEMICSINSPMQCMMKGICGQCVQKVNNDRGYIFSCVCQDQNSDIMDFDILKTRLKQNSLLEKFCD